MDLSQLSKIYRFEKSMRDEINSLMPLGWEFGYKVADAVPFYYVTDDEITLLVNGGVDLESIFQSLYAMSVSERMESLQRHPYKIYEYMDDLDQEFVNPYHLPSYINYKTQLNTRLFPVHTFNKGELQRTMYYGTYDEETETYSEPVLCCDFAYTRDPLNFAIKRDTVRKWFRTNEVLEESSVKTSTKYYDQQQRIREGKRRRGNVMDDITITVMGMIIATELPKGELSPYSNETEVVAEGKRFLAYHKDAFTNYIDDANEQIIDDIILDSTHWLSNIIDGNGTTILDYLVNELT